MTENMQQLDIELKHKNNVINELEYKIVERDRIIEKLRKIISEIKSLTYEG